VIAPEADAKPEGKLKVPKWSEIKPVKWISIILYCLLVVCSIYLIVKSKLYQTEMFAILALYLLFNFSFHQFYGRVEEYLYTTHYTFALIALLALPFKLKSINRNFNYALNIILTLFLVFLLVTNISFMKDFIAIF